MMVCKGRTGIHLSVEGKFRVDTHNGWEVRVARAKLNATCYCFVLESSSMAQCSRGG
jgi:hypothetical protein